MVPLLGGDGGTHVGEERLDALERSVLDQRRKVALRVYLPPRHRDSADVDRVAKSRSKGLRRQGSSTPCRESKFRNHFQDLVAMVQARREELERLDHEAGALRIWEQRLAAAGADLQVTDRRLPGPLSTRRGGLHPGNHLHPLLQVLVLGKGREHPFHQFSGWSVVDRLGYRSKADPKSRQEMAYDGVIVKVPGEPIHAVDDHAVDAATVAAAVG
ncbi:MAG TPA: hypothetical protein VHB47_22875 [Thermoanaerobaculia bacterium]|nr:hypothetical protein [Thermoanaerobaculia bacterium]